MKKKSIGQNMRAIKTTLDKTINHPKLCEQIAFDLAEIYDELDQVKSLIDEILTGKPLTLKKIKQLSTILADHWPYHLKTLKRSFSKLENE